MKSARDIISDYLKENDYDGLARKGGLCGCDLGEIMCTDDGCDGECFPAYKHNFRAGGLYYMSTLKDIDKAKDEFEEFMKEVT